jgi:hypothetical protein
MTTPSITASSLNINRLVSHTDGGGTGSCGSGSVVVEIAA